MSNSSIWSLDRILSGATTPSQSEPGSDSNEGVAHIPQRSSITGASPSDCLVLYPGHLLEESYPSAEMQSVYSTVPAGWANEEMNKICFFLIIKDSESSLMSTILFANMSQISNSYLFQTILINVYQKSYLWYFFLFLKKLKNYLMIYTATSKKNHKYTSEWDGNNCGMKMPKTSSAK